MNCSHSNGTQWTGAKHPQVAKGVSREVCCDCGQFTSGRKDHGTPSTRDRGRASANPNRWWVKLRTQPTQASPEGEMESGN